jgi:hypothetical protein
LVISRYINIGIGCTSKISRKVWRVVETFSIPDRIVIRGHSIARYPTYSAERSHKIFATMLASYLVRMIAPGPPKMPASFLSQGVCDCEVFCGSLHLKGSKAELFRRLMGF